MSRNYYSEINLHIVWHTKNSLPLLTREVEAFTHQRLKTRVVETEGAFVHAIGGTVTHVHLVVTLAPNILISDFIGKLKGGTSHDVNHRGQGNAKLLEWQAGYGVVSFGTRDLDWVVKYVRNQHEHHAQRSVQDRLERMSFEND